MQGSGIIKHIGEEGTTYRFADGSSSSILTEKEKQEANKVLRDFMIR